eukprot:403358708
MRKSIIFIAVFFMLSIYMTNAQGGGMGGGGGMREGGDEDYSAFYQGGNRLNLNGLFRAWQRRILNYIRYNGLYLGNRWVIREEGTGSYEALVFRDYRSSGDKRYAMFRNLYVDLV